MIGRRAFIQVAIAGPAAWSGSRAYAQAGVTLGGVAVPGFETPSLAAAELERLHRAVAPGAEKWAEIPWETDLGAARARAVQERKPLLMWVMDGHPLGCT